LGSILLEEGLPDYALEHFEKALEAAPQKLLVHYTIANCYSRKGLVELAVKYMCGEQAIVDLDVCLTTCTPGNRP